MSTPFRITASTGLHKGGRDQQLDRVAILAHRHAHGCVLVVVADAMEVMHGSSNAADQVLMTATQLFERFKPGANTPQWLLTTLIEEAHVVLRLSMLSAAQESHCAVAAFLIMPDGSCHWVHSGDSRIYHFRDGKLVTRTNDHSYVQALVDAGAITQQQAHDHPQAHILLGCLGAEISPPYTLHSIEKLLSGDVVFAATDGLWRNLSSEEMGSITQTMTVRDASQNLVQFVVDRTQGRGDNLAMAIIKIESLQAAAPVASKTAPVRLQTLA